MLYAVDAASGQERWQVETPAPIRTRPAVANGIVYAGSDDGVLYVIDAGTGTERWRFATGDKIWSTPVVNNGIVFFGSVDRILYALDAATGAERWRLVTSEAIIASPVVVDGTLYIGGGNRVVYAVDAATGFVRWRYVTGEAVRWPTGSFTLAQRAVTYSRFRLPRTNDPPFSGMLTGGCFLACSRRLTRTRRCPVRAYDPDSA